MPQIVEYINKENIQPTDRGTEARVQEGRRVGAFFNQRAESLRDFGNRTAQQIGGAIRDASDVAYQYQEHRDVNQGIDTYWPMRAKKENDWNDIVKGNPDKGIPPADPNDPAIAQRFMEGVRSDFQKWGEAFHTEGGKKWAQARTESFLSHMQEKTTADMGTLAAQQVSNSLHTASNTAENIAYNSPDAVPHLIDDMKATVGGSVASSPNLKGATAARVTMEESEKRIERIVKAGMLGGIEKNKKDPEGEAQKWITKYPQYINGAEAVMGAKAAKFQVKQNESMDRAATQAARQEANDAASAASAKNMADNVSVDANGRVTLKPAYFKNAQDIAKRYGEIAPNAAADMRTLIDWGRRQIQERKENVVSDPSVMGDLYTRLRDDNNPTTAVQILEAETTGKLSRTDTQNLTNLHKAIEDANLHGPVFNTAMKAAEEALGAGLVDDGHERYANFMQRFIPEYQKLLRSPGATAGALNLKDPNSLISKLLDEYKPDAVTLQSARMIKKLFPGEGLQSIVPPPGFDASGKPISSEARPKVPITRNDIQMLKNNPSMRGDFDRKFGPGQAEKILGK